MNWILLATPVFFALIAVEVIASYLMGRKTYRMGDAVNSISLGVMSELMKVFTFALRAGIYVAVFNQVALTRLPANEWWVWGLALLMYDFCYYWYHRCSHTVAVMWAAHVVHHQSQDFNLSTALRQPSSGSLISWMFYMPLAIVGVPPRVFIAVGLIDLLYQYWVHTELIGKLGWFDRVFCSPSNHRVHHAVNEVYLDHNYGGILVIWDRMFGTFVEEKERCIYGTRAALMSFDPVWANLQVYAGLIRTSFRTRGWADKGRVWVKRPGWQPADLAAAEPGPAFAADKVELFDPKTSAARRVFGALNLGAIILCTVAFTGRAWAMPLLAALVIYLSLVAALWAVGGVLERRLSVLEALFIQAAALACASRVLGIGKWYVPGGVSWEVNWDLVFLVAKPLALTLALLAVVARFRTPADAPLSQWVALALGLLASLVGDVQLMLPDGFIAGLIAFLVAHVCYLVMLTRDVRLLPSWKAVAAVLVIDVAFGAVLWPALPPELRIPVAGYFAVISLMAAQALGRAAVKRDAAAVLVGIGAVVFMASDALLALNRFVLPDVRFEALVLPTYYVAQALIALYVLPRPQLRAEDVVPMARREPAAAMAVAAE